MYIYIIFMFPVISTILGARHKDLTMSVLLQMLTCVSGGIYSPCEKGTEGSIQSSMTGLPPDKVVQCDLKQLSSRCSKNDFFFN